MTDTTPEMPLRIWARAVTNTAGVWLNRDPSDGDDDARAEYIRADAEAGMRRIEAIAESARKAEAERDIYRRALESITKTGHQDIERELSRIDAIAVDALVDGDALRDTRDLARADGGSGQSGAGASNEPPHKSSERTSLIDDPTMTRQAGERPAD